MTQDPVAKTWAVVVGISKYPKLGGGQQLKFADSDATAFAEAIKKAGATNETIRLLVNQNATAAAIKEAIGNWLARTPSEDDTVCIYFSGHGFVEKSFDESYLLGYDSDIKSPYSTAISLTELSYALSRRIKARRILLIGDAVREDFFKSGDEEKADSVTFSKTFIQLSEWRSGISVMLANGEGEFSREGQRWNAHGVFTKYLIEAIGSGADHNRDGLTNAIEAFDYVATQVARDTSKKQNPAWSGNTMSQIVLAGRGAPVTNVATPASTRAEAVKSEVTPTSVATGEPPGTTKPASPPPVSTRKEIASISNDSVQASESNRATNPPSTPAGSQPPAVTTRNATNNPVSSAPTTTTSRPENTKVTVPESNPPEAASTQPPTNPDSVARGTKPEPRRTPPSTRTVQPSSPTVRTQPENTTSVRVENLPAPPAPVKTPPNVSTVSTTAVSTSTATEKLNTSLPVGGLATPPSPLINEFESALSDGRLVEPKGSSAWDIYQQLSQQPANRDETLRFKSRLTDALINGGKVIVIGNLRGDDISERVEDIRRAGQMFARARTLTPDNSEIAVLEKLSAAQALIALQFYDEAERALSLIPRTAASENSLGIVFTGKLDYWKAERAFKNAIEMDAAAAMPHYNLGLLYRMQKNEGALAEFESAAKLDSSNPAIFVAVGDEYFSQSKWQPATEAYRKAVALKPLDDTLHTKLGHALYSQGLRDEANKSYQRAKELRR